ncbi:MAG: hypothetical protein JWO38_7629 [Gemmataceae bacterium]|nr:hypothetical protein [Gemmataceae bacterium]
MVLTGLGSGRATLMTVEAGVPDPTLNTCTPTHRRDAHPDEGFRTTY